MMNDDYSYSSTIDWGAIFGWTAIVVVVLTVVFVIVMCVRDAIDSSRYDKAEDAAYAKIEAMSFNGREVEVFLDATDWDFQDFVDSPGVQKMFREFTKTGHMPTIKKTVTNEETTVIPIIMPR